MCLIAGVTGDRIGNRIFHPLNKEAEFVGILNAVVVEVQHKTGLGELTVGVALCSVVSKAGDGQRGFAVCIADHAVQVRAFLVLRVSLALDVLYPVDGLHRRVDIVLDVPEDDLVALRRKHQLLLIGIRGVAADLLEGLRHHRVAGLNSHGLGELISRALFEILYGVFNLRLGHIDERIIIAAFNVEGYGVAACLRKIAGLVAFFQLRAGFCIKRLGGSRKSAADRVIRYIGKRIIFISHCILDGIRHQRIGTPRSIEVEVTVYGHLEVKCLFFTVFGSVKPADELVCAAFWFLRSSYRGVVRNLFPCVQRIFLVYNILCQEGFNGMGRRRPLGIEDHIRRGHCHCVEIDLGTFETIDRCVPPGKHKGVRFKFCGVARLEIVAFQRRFVLYAPAFSFYFGIIVEEGQVVAVAGIAEVVVFIYTVSLSTQRHFVKCGVRPPLGKAGNIMEFL